MGVTVLPNVRCFDFLKHDNYNIKTIVLPLRQCLSTAKKLIMYKCSKFKYKSVHFPSHMAEDHNVLIVLFDHC